MRMPILKVFLAALMSLLLTASVISAPSNMPAKVESILGEHQWIHGSEDCAVNLDSGIDVYAHDQTTYIFRQNKCQTFEAPFIYVLVGASKILVLDTGDIEDLSASPVLQALRSVLGEETIESKAILVVHSHSHRDHSRGDSQFEGKPNVTIVEPSNDGVKRFFDFKEWPNGQASIELGERTLLVIPTPGHQEEAITIYDPQTKWLLTGDTLYPGYIYVKNWDEYTNSIARLALFSELNDVAAVLGSHIEMTSKPGIAYPVGTTFQPDEAALDLTPHTLRQLSGALQEPRVKKELVFDSFIVKQMNVIQRTLSNFARWITQ